MTAFYWWFGPSQTREQVSHELEAMRAAGIGRTYIFPCYPLTADDSISTPYLSPKFLDVLRFALQRASELSMTTDLLVGTGWPFGGPGIELEKSSRTMRRIPTQECVCCAVMGQNAAPEAHMWHMGGLRIRQWTHEAGQNVSGV